MHNHTNIFAKFAQIAKQYKTRKAVICSGSGYTYAELLDCSESIARKLVSKFGTGEKIGVIYTRNEELIAIILAILRSGCCYVPIDPRNPVERIKYICADAGIKLIISRPKYQYLVPKNIEFTTFDRLIFQPQTNQTNNFPKVMGNDLAYVIYTSGTTGKPKGVMTEHHAVLTLLDSILEHDVSFTFSDAWTMFHSYAFDFSIWEIFGAILSGATLHIINDELMRDISAFYNYLCINKITLLSLTPSVFKQLLILMPKNGLANLRYIVLGGERFDLVDYARWLEKSPAVATKLLNMYGPTETTVFATIYALTPDVIAKYSQLSPIGIPLKHFNAFILDDSLQPVADEAIGELYIAGSALARGYLNKAQLTAECFVSIPDYIHSKYSIMYKTGDLANSRDGIIFYQGRADNQIKLRGYRIELDEIEKTIVQLPAITSACVLVDDTSGHQILVAFYAAANTLTDMELKQHVKQLLPVYMLPDEFIYVPDMPVNINGKINKPRLKEIYAAINEELANENILADDRDQQLMLRCWHQVLGNKVKLNPYSNFFKCGGYSLLTFKLLAEINQVFKVSAKITLINSYPIFMELLDEVKKLAQLDDNSKLVTKSIHMNLFPATYNQLALYYTCALQGNKTYNISFEVVFNKLFSLAQLRHCLLSLVNDAPELRTCFVYNEGILCQQILAKITADQVLQICKFQTENKALLLENLANYDFDLGNYLFQFKYLQPDSGLPSLFINIHHTIFDGSSLNIFIDSLLKYLNNKYIPHNGPSYQDFTFYQQRLLSDPEYLTTAKGFWHKQINVDSMLQLRFSDVKAARATQIGNYFSLSLNNNLIEKTDHACQRLNVSPYIVYLFAYSALLYNYTSGIKFAIGVPYANRPLEFLNTFGYFINTLPMTFDFNDQSKSLTEVIKELQELHLHYMENQELPLSIILEKHDSNDKLNTFFAYQRGILWQKKEDDIVAQLHLVSNNTAKFDLFLAVNSLDESEIELAFEFNPKILSLAFVQNLAIFYKNFLSKLADQLMSDNELSLAEFLLKINQGREIVIAGQTHLIHPNNLIGLFKYSVLHSPESIAIFDDNTQLSYRQIDQQSDKIAKRILTTCTNQMNKSIGLYFRRTLDLPLYILGVLKAGFAYIPLNEEFPVRRIAQICEVAQPQLILTNIDGATEHTHINDFIELGLDEEDIHLPDLSTQPETLAYIMFTSGTTGQPKGVSLSHKALANRIIWLRDRYQLTANDSMFMKTPFNFDVSCGEIFLPLASGAKLFVANYQAHKNLNYILDKVSSLKITHIYFVPTMLSIFLQYIHNLEKYSKDQFQNLKMIFCSGEALNQAVVNECYQIFPQVKIYNQYGPTEAGEVSDYLCKLNDDYHIVPIGNPLYNSKFMVVDKNNTPVLQGVSGELLIGGACLADGYYKQDLLTKQKFEYHEFLKERIYRTGDLVVIDQQNNLCFLERMDNQTKINGIRIELGEIEQTLLNHPNISQVFVCILKEQGYADKLVAFYITKNLITLSDVDLSQFLKAYLPQYMLPTNYMYLETIPTNVNGKIDRNKCLAQFKVSSSRTAVNQIDLAAFNNSEQKIIHIWCQLLNLDVTTISLEDNFLLSGGSSLLISRLILELEQQVKFTLNMFEIINLPTLHNLLAIYNNKTLMAEDVVSIMADDIEQCRTFSVARNLLAEEPIKSILLTGASGFIGRHTLSELRITYPEAEIICLHRNQNSLNSGKICYIQGDLEQAQLGLKSTDYAYICKNVDVIIHIAAVVNHLFAYKEHRQGNIMATRDLVQIALTHKRKRLLFISTTGTESNNVTLTEQNELIKIKDSGGYLLSKMISEKIIYQASQHYHLMAQIIRLGYVGPGIRDYDINHHNNHLYALFKSFIVKRCVPEVDADFECLPVDEVAQQIVARLAYSGPFIIHNLANAKIITWNQVYAILENIMGIKLTRIERLDWINNILKKADPKQEDYLFKLIPLYNETAEQSVRFRLDGDVISQINYQQIIQSYVNAVNKYN